MRPLSHGCVGLDKGIKHPASQNQWITHLDNSSYLNRQQLTWHQLRRRSLCYTQYSIAVERQRALDVVTAKAAIEVRSRLVALDEGIDAAIDWLALIGEWP